MKSKEDILREKIPSEAEIPTKYRPAKNNLLIIPLPEQGITKGGLILPDRSRVTYNEGHVMACGPMCSDTIGVGDCVTWAQNAEMIVTVEDGRSFIILPEGEVVMYISRSELEQQP